MNQDSVAQDVSPALSSEGSDERERLLGSESVKFQTSRDSENGDKGESLLASGSNLYDGGRTWPISLVYIVANEFCERFCYYGMRAILTLYFLYYFEWDEDRAVVMYHTFIMLCYLTPVLGGALADGALGKYKTIMILSVVYVIGTAIMSGTAVNGATGQPPSPWGAVLGLLFIAVGTGGIKPCVAAFGGDQINEDDAKLVETYFAAFYFSINAGSFVSTIVTPKLRADVACFGREDCYPLAFGVPGCLMLTALLLFIAGRRMYVIRKPQRNVTVDFAGAVRMSVAQKWKQWRGRSGIIHHTYWLDAARKKYGEDFIDDVKVALGVMWLFVPLPIFWALFDQSGSRWTVQATQMKTFDMGALGEFRPDQMQAVNSLLILLFIPLFEKVLYPTARRMGIKAKPLGRMSLGMLLCSLSFVIAALVQLSIDHSRVVPAPTNNASALVRIVSVVDTDINVTWAAIPSDNDLAFGNATNATYALAAVSGATDYINTYVGDDTDVSIFWETATQTGEIFLLLAAGAVRCLVLYNEEDAVESLVLDELFDRSQSGQSVVDARVEVVNVASSAGAEIVVTSSMDDDFQCIVPFRNSSAYIDGTIISGKQKLQVTNNTQGAAMVSDEIKFADGTDYLVVVADALAGGNDAVGVRVNVFGSTAGAQLSIAWQLPQYAILTAGEVLFSITGLEFAFSQAPSSMKAILQAAWLLTVACGSFIVIVVAESKLIANQVGEFFFFAALQLFVTIIFVIMGKYYKYKTPQGDTHTVQGTAEKPSPSGDVATDVLLTKSQASTSDGGYLKVEG